MRDQGPTTADPVEIAMTAERGDSAPDAPSRQLLIEHRRLVRSQIANERAALVLRVLTGVAGLIVAALFLALVWDAANTRTLVVRPFSVPPDMAARGLTGEVVATRMLDQLDAMDRGILSVRAASTYANDWGDDVEVQIPQTGVSVGELQTLLRRWLGDETRITGDVVRLSDGRLSVGVRSGGGAPAPAIAGQETDFEALLQQAAERVYRATQPERYAAWLAQQGKRDEAVAVYRELSTTGSPESRAWAMTLWGDLEQDPLRSLELHRRARRLDPEQPHAAEGAANALSVLGHDEAEFAENQRAVELLSGGRAGDYAPWAAAFHLASRRAAVATALGDLQGAVAIREQASNPSPDQPPVACQRCGGGSLLGAAALAAANRDEAASRRLRNAGVDIVAQAGPFYDAYLPVGLAVANEDWRTAAAMLDEPERLARIQALAGSVGVRTSVLPLQAEVLGRVGRFREAAALVVQTPRDCGGCLRARAKLFALMGRHAEADRLFAEAARSTPSLPAAHAEWARARLDRGDAAGALRLAQEASRRGPRWAEPLKLQGDALARQGRWADAAARYRAAAEFAPHWRALRQALAQAERRSAS